MRIRLRVPKDGAEKSQGLRGWFRQVFGTSDEPEEATAAGTPPIEKSRIDRRWTAVGEEVAYLPVGRRCVRVDGEWRTDFLFEVRANGDPQQVRIQIAEAALKDWETKNGTRMPEAGRVRLAKERLEAALREGRWAGEQTVEAEAIAELTI